MAKEFESQSQKGTSDDPWQSGDPWQKTRENLEVSDSPVSEDSAKKASVQTG